MKEDVSPQMRSTDEACIEMVAKSPLRKWATFTIIVLTTSVGGTVGTLSYVSNGKSIEWNTASIISKQEATDKEISRLSTDIRSNSADIRKMERLMAEEISEIKTNQRSILVEIRELNHDRRNP